MFVCLLTSFDNKTELLAPHHVLCFATPTPQSTSTLFFARCLHLGRHSIVRMYHHSNLECAFLKKLAFGGNLPNDNQGFPRTFNAEERKKGRSMSVCWLGQPLS